MYIIYTPSHDLISLFIQQTVCMYLVFVQYWALELLIKSIKHVVFFCQGTNVDMGESSL